MVVLLCLPVDVDGKIWLVSCQVHPLCILVITFFFEFSSLLDIEHGILRLGQIAGYHLIGLVPFVGTNIHLEGLDKFTSVDIVLLCQVQLPHLGVVLRDLFVVGPSDLWRLVGDQLDGSVPLSRIEGGLDCFVED